MTVQSTQTEPLFVSFVALLLDTLAQLVPAEQEDDAAASATRRDIARLLFEAFAPRDAIEAMLAARAVAMHHATMDSLVRAAAPGTSDEKAIRLTASATAASRAFDAALRTLEKRRAQPSPCATAPAVESLPDSAPARAVRQPKATALADAPIRIPGWPEATRRETHRAAYLASTALSTTQRPELAHAG